MNHAFRKAMKQSGYEKNEWIEILLAWVTAGRVTLGNLLMVFVSHFLIFKNISNNSNLTHRAYMMIKLINICKRCLEYSKSSGNFTHYYVSC